MNATTLISLDSLDHISSLLRQRDVVVIQETFTGRYVVTLHSQPIASGSDLVQVAREAWEIIRADAAVRGLPPPLTQNEQMKVREEFERQHMLAMLTMKEAKLHYFQKLNHADNQRRSAAEDYQLAASQGLLGKGKAAKGGS